MPSQSAGVPFRQADPPGMGRVDVVAIGVSTGGPDALAVLMPGIKESLPVPILVVQHMPPVFTGMLADRLAARCCYKVVEAREGDPVRPGFAYIAPGNYHMAVRRAADGVRVRLSQDPPVNACRPAVDVLFRALPGVYGPRVLAVVMTGMGSDGLSGCERVRGAGGRVLVQDEPSSVVWGMPGSVAKAGLADRVVALDKLAPEIVRRAWAGRVKQAQ